MSSSEFKLRKLLEDATFFIKNVEEDETYWEKCRTCMDQADQLIRLNTRESFLELSPESIVMFAEVALLMRGERDEDAQRVLEIFFQRVNQEDQFLCRALLAQATVEEKKITKLQLKGDDNLKQVQLAYTFIKRALDIATKPENKQKYAFIVYNSSIKTWHIIRSLMKPGWSKNLVEMLEKISNLLEEMDDSDFNWRCRYLNALVKAMFDLEKKPEALKVLDKLYDLTKKKGECKFQETLFRNRMHLYRDNNGVLGAIKKETETGADLNGYKSLYIIQSIRSNIIPDAQVEKELTAVMAGLCPASISSDPIALQQASKITPLVQDRLAECGRLAIKYNLVQLCESACNVVNRARQGSLRAKLWTEYSKAELLIKKPQGDLDKKSGMKLNTFQKQVEDFERRVEALKILDRAMIANKRLGDSDIIIEGCVLIWNIALPMLKKSTRVNVYKPFLSAASSLENIMANDNVLRVCFHLELAKYEIDQDFLTKAQNQLEKALNIDYSLTLKQLQVDIKEDDDSGDFQRPFQKILKFLLKKLSLKTNLYGGDPSNMQEQIILDVENAKTTRNSKMRETLLDKALKALQDFEENEFSVDPASNMVEEEIKVAQKKFHLNKIRERKDRVLIATEIGKLAIEENIVQIAFEAGTYATQSDWDAQKNMDLIIAQSESHFILSKCYVEYLLEEDIEIGYKELVTIYEDQADREFTNEDRTKYQQWKLKFCEHIQKGVKLGQVSQQSWLVFNGAIELWNNYLPVFKKYNFYDLFLSEAMPALIECFEAMNNCFINASFSSENVDYELDKKMQVFSFLSMNLARIYEFLGKNDDTVRVCDVLLQKQLPSHLRKTFDSIKARITKQVSNLGGGGGAKAAPKGGKDAPVVQVYQPSKTEVVTSEVLSMLEIIQNTSNKDMVQKAMEALNLWLPNQLEEIELELNVELWCRLGRLACNMNTNPMIKIALYCSEMALKNADEKAKNKQYTQIPTTRLRWYAVAESLYGESLFKLLDTQKQEKDSQDKLLHMSVSHFVESCNIGSKANIGYLVLESAKLMWNALLPLLDAPNNRKMLIKPMQQVHTYLKTVQENTDPDFLVLLYSALFTCIGEQREWKIGEQITEEAFQYIPPTHQKVLWEAKMLFLSKLGKNVLNAISNMKESNASLMAKVWVKLARSSSNQQEQHSAYTKAIEILRKEESVEVVEVLIEFAEWLHRKNYSTQDVEDQLQLGVDLLMDIEPGWGDDDDDEAADGDGDDEAKTRKTGKSKSSKMSKQSKAKTRVSKAGKSTLKSKVGAQSKKSKASKRSAAMKSKVGSMHSKKTTTALSKRQDEDQQPMFLNCSHFEKLVRIHSMLATISPDAYKQKEYALDAQFFCMKMWEQSFQTLNAITFFDEHKAEVEELGFTQGDQESRRQYFAEVFTNTEVQIPVKFTLPEKLDDWTGFSVPEQFYAKCKGHEDKIMVAKWTFVKPELTLYHLQNIQNILEEHYFTMQMLPVLELIKLFSKVVLEEKILEEVLSLKKARILLNLGLKQEGDQIKQSWDQSPDRYKLTEEEKKLNLEKIKALKDENDNLVDKYVSFPIENDLEPLVLESLRIHELWVLYAEELLKWGEFIPAKEVIMEVNLHSRILKDQNNYAKSLLMLSTIAFLEGDSAAALRCDMMCHQYAKEISLVEKAIEHTFDLLLMFNKIEDCATLVNSSMDMVHNLRDKHNKTNAQSNTQAVRTTTINNLPLEFLLGTVYLLKAILSIKESQSLANQAQLPASNTLSRSQKLIQDPQELKMDESFAYIDAYDLLVGRVGYKQSHLEKLIKYAQILQNEMGNAVNADIKHVEFAKAKLERNAKILLRVQDLLQNQAYYIGVHPDSTSSRISLPLVRQQGIVKLRIAQVNTHIGVLKNCIKVSSSTSMDPEKKLDKVVATFMDAVTKQIETQTNTYKQKMNRYEKSIAILHSALNLIHPMCPESAEAFVEIAKCKRLLAVNKKHLRGHWRQDAIEVDKVNLKQMQLDREEADRKDELEGKGLQGEVKDIFIDYKEEALRTFIDLIETGPGGLSSEKTTFQKLLERIGTSTIENTLGTFALEYSECRGNLNREQSFFYLALYQYSVSRQSLLQTYLNASTEQHPDILRIRQNQHLKQEFGVFACPAYPKNYYRLEEELKEQSKPFKILSSYYPIEDFKENLPHSSAYLVIQLSEDKQQLYYGFMQISKERKISYFMSKYTLSDIMRDKLFEIIENLAQNKIALQKTPITIQEDLDNLERDAEYEISKMMEELEIFFDPLTKSLQDLISPILKSEEDEQIVQQTAVGGKGQPPKKEEKKAAPAKAAPKAGGKAAAGELAAYESNLPLPTSGIESLIILVDSRIETLPLEQLKVFQKVPVVGRDFNLHMYMNRLKTIGHQAPIHNNTGISKEGLRYIFDAPQPLEEKSQTFMATDVPKLMPNSKWEGILSRQQHIPSDGEWQRLISQASLFSYFSMTCLLHKFPPFQVSDLSIFSKCKAMFIIDRMNSFKTLVDRNVLTSKHFVPNEQPLQQVALFSLCGVSTIVTNHWSTKPEANFEMFESLMRGCLTDGQYLGAALRKYKEDKEVNGVVQKRKNLQKLNTVTFGVPIIRIV